MAKRLPPKELELYRETRLKSGDAELTMHLGHYFMWYGIVEVNITTLLANVLGYHEYDRMEFLTRGMDARVKCERLRQAAKAYSKLGPNLSVRLSYFERYCTPLRNKLAHCWPYFDKEKRIIEFSTIGRAAKFLRDSPLTPLKIEPEKIHIDDLLSEAAWLNSFAVDLIDAISVLVHGESPEIVDPKSGLPLEDHPENPPQDDPAKPDKPPQTQGE